jgi:hypothetical protein
MAGSQNDLINLRDAGESGREKGEGWWMKRLGVSN